MTVDEDEYPPPLPRHRRVSEPPLSRDDDFGREVGADPEMDADSASGVDAGHWFDAGPIDPAPTIIAGTERMTSPQQAGRAAGHTTEHAHHTAHAQHAQHADTAGDVRPADTGPVPTHHATASGRSSINLDALRNGPMPIVGAVAALLLAAGLIGWLFRGSGGGDEVTIGGSEADGAAADQNGSSDGSGDGVAGSLPPLSPATLPAADEPGLVGLELPLMDVYTGTGSNGSVQLYLNSLSGQVCHQFTAGAMSGRYRAYIHEAQFPKEGPIVVDLGEVENAVPRCVNSNPIDLARALGNTEGFYVAAHSANQDFVLRGQLSSSITAFDNRDPATVADQEAAAATTATTVGDGSDDDLFGMPDEGAYLVVDAGRVTFEGMVPDADTAERLRAAFVPLSGMGVEVVDNLVIQAGSPPPSGRVIVADALLFESGQDRIDGDSPVLSTLADLMIVNPTWTMTITGHTDDVGDWLFNIELSLRRANNVRSRLAELGVPAERIRVQGAGPEQPIADNETDEGRARNRRIEISIDS